MAVPRWAPADSPVQLIGLREAEAATGHLLIKAITITRSGLEPWRAYNLTVEADHTYFVGNLDAWVHNADDCGKYVYRYVEDGVVKYVGITKEPAIRAAAHLREKGLANPEQLFAGPISARDARLVEQVLIELHGLGMNGGSLMNKINSISPSKPLYQELSRGVELLKSVGYKL